MSPMAGRLPQPRPRTHLSCALALCAAIAAWLPAIAQASDDDLVYPKFECYDVLDANAYTFRFGTFSFKDSAATPAIAPAMPSTFNAIRIASHRVFPILGRCPDIGAVIFPRRSGRSFDAADEPQHLSIT